VIGFITLTLIVGVNLLFWSAVGAMRFLTEAWSRRRMVGARSRHPGVGAIPDRAEVAVLIAAHNEELIIGRTISSASGLVAAEDIYVVSDGSSDATAPNAKAAGVNVLELARNRGKGGALVAGIEHFDLCQRYAVVLLLDADTVLSPDYLETGLPLFADPDVAAVAGRATTMWRPGELSLRGQFLVAYREWLYVWMQEFIRYGQGWRYADSVLVVPGFASMYRTSALKELEINAPGLVIEDLNMTFEVHHKRLGRIAFHPRAAVGYTQDPDNFRDYIRQVKRWTLALWQTVRRHGLFHRGRFWATLALYLTEVITSSLFALLAPVVLALKVSAEVQGLDVRQATGVVGWLFDNITLQTFLLAVVLPQYVFTVLVAALRRRPRYLLLGLGFPLLRIIDAAIALYTLPRAWTERSTGSWTSPRRRQVSM
jgi:biofilm PGA synthesis N-glycosyltransferase PgaC